MGKGAGAFSEGTSYEPKPFILHWAGSSPEMLQIGGCLAPDGRGEAPVYRQGQAGTETIFPQLDVHSRLGRSPSQKCQRSRQTKSQTRRRQSAMETDLDHKAKTQTKSSHRTNRTNGRITKRPSKDKRPQQWKQAWKSQSWFCQSSPKVSRFAVPSPSSPFGGNCLPDGRGTVTTNTGQGPPFPQEPYLGDPGPILAGIMALPLIPKLLSPPPVALGLPCTPRVLYPTADEER